jgi:hypothetical protein
MVISFCIDRKSEEKNGEVQIGLNDLQRGWEVRVPHGYAGIRAVSQSRYPMP